MSCTESEKLQRESAELVQVPQDQDRLESLCRGGCNEEVPWCPVDQFAFGGELLGTTLNKGLVC